MRNKIDKIEERLLKHTKTEQEVRIILGEVLSNIKFLESIYMTGGENNKYSREFRDMAHKERQEACLISSACYSILRQTYKVDI